jgi:N-acetylneuraminic acid mutarotase
VQRRRRIRTQGWRRSVNTRWKKAPRYNWRRKFYVAGGFNNFDGLAYLDVYDPATNTWSTLAPVPQAGRLIGAVLGGKLFVISGSGTERRAYAYNPGNNTWKTRAAPKWDHDTLVWVTLDGLPYLLAVGGPNDSELYTP